MKRIPLSPTVSQILTGALVNEPMRVDTVQRNGDAGWIVGLVDITTERFRRVTLTSDDLARLTILSPQYSYDGDELRLRLGFDLPD
jgi:hypothetical protein